MYIYVYTYSVCVCVCMTLQVVIDVVLSIFDFPQVVIVLCIKVNYLIFD
jgi:hypothetical protein